MSAMGSPWMVSIPKATTTVIKSIRVAVCQARVGAIMLWLLVTRVVHVQLPSVEFLTEPVLRARRVGRVVFDGGGGERRCKSETVS